MMRKSYPCILLVLVMALMSLAEANHHHHDHERENNRELKRRTFIELNDEPIPVPCAEEVTEFLSYVGVQFVGNEQDLGCCEIPLLEDGFKLIYEALTKDRCDSLFRTVQDVRLNIAPPPKAYYYRNGRQRRMQSTSASNSSAVPDGSSFFNTAGECRNCPTDNGGSSNLFDDGFRRRRALAEKELLMEGYMTLEDEHKPHHRHQNRRRLPGNEEHHYYESYDGPDRESHPPPYEPELTGECTCPAGTVDIGYYGRIDIGPDAPTIEEFRRAFNDYIDMLVGEGFMESVTGIAALQEFQRGPGGAVLEP